MKSVVLESEGKDGVSMWPRGGRVIWGRQSICADVLLVGDIEQSVLIASGRSVARLSAERTVGGGGRGGSLRIMKQGCGGGVGKNGAAAGPRGKAVLGP